MDCGQVRSYKIDQTMSIWYTGSENRNLLQFRKARQVRDEAVIFYIFCKVWYKNDIASEKGSDSWNDYTDGQMQSEMQTLFGK